MPRYKTNEQLQKEHEINFKFSAAIERDDIGMVKKLMPMAELKNKESNIFICVMINVAIENNNHEILHMLIAKFLNENLINIACQWNIKRVIQTIFELKPKFKCKYFINNSPLHICAQFNSVECCKYLLMHHQPMVNVNDKSVGYGTTPLHTACSYSNIEIVKLLCDSANMMQMQMQMKKQPTPPTAVVPNHIINIEMNATDCFKRNAFFIACSNLNLDIVKYLLNRNSSFHVNALDAMGNSAFSIACRNNSLAIVNYLLVNKNSLELHVNENCLYIKNYKKKYPHLRWNQLGGGGGNKQ